MPLRAFGDYNYKWTVEKMKKLGLTRAFGSHVIPPYYLTPPYLNAIPDIEEMNLLKNDENSLNNNQRFVILATDGLWELFESTRKVVKCVFKHNKHKENDETKSDKGNLTEEIRNDILKLDEYNEDDPFIDKNSATYLIRTALGSDPSADPHDMRQHQRLETYLTLPQSVVRNFRDDISVIVLELE